MSREKTPPCSRGCGQRVWFNWSAKAGEPGRSDFGKLRPLQVSEEGEMLNETHDCPNSDYNKKQQSRQVPTSSASTTTAYSAGNMEAVLGNTMDAIARIEKLDHTVNMIGTLDQQLSGKIDRLQHDLDELIPRFNQLVEHIIHNPLDDDGDSQRENPEPEP
jgi:hypothetical protein